LKPVFQDVIRQLVWFSWTLLNNTKTSICEICKS